MSRSPVRAISNEKHLYFVFQPKAKILAWLLRLPKPGAFPLGWLNRQTRSFYTLAVLSLILSGSVIAELAVMAAGPHVTPADYSPSASPNDDPLQHIISDDRPPASVDRWESITLAHPLFSPSRLPVVIATEVEKPVPLPRLSGILLSDNKKIGIFYNTDDSPILVTEGSSLGAFKVLSITRNSLLISGPAGIETLYPSDGSGQIASKYAATSSPNTDDTSEFGDSNSWPMQ